MRTRVYSLFCSLSSFAFSGGFGKKEMSGHPHCDDLTVQGRLPLGAAASRCHSPLGTTASGISNTRRQTNKMPREEHIQGRCVCQKNRGVHTRLPIRANPPPARTQLVPR